MEHLSDPALRDLAVVLDQEHERLGLTPPFLYGLHADGRYERLDEGDPYRMLELFRLLPEERFAGLALVCGGWGAPQGEGRPSRHPARVRVRTVCVMAADGRDVTLLRRAQHGPELLPGGEGPLVEALREAAARLGGGAPTAA